AIFLYGVVLWVILKQEPEPILSEGSFHFLVALSGSMALTGIGLHCFLGRESYLRSTLRNATDQQFASIKQTYPALTDEETKIASLLPNLFIRTLLPLIFIEGVAILGFIAALITGSFITYLYFSSVAFLLQLAVCPRPENFLKQCREVTDTELTTDNSHL